MKTRATTRKTGGWREALQSVAGLVAALSAWGTPAVVINEINYDPPENTSLLEFVELYNNGSNTVDLSGWSFTAGIDYTFPAGTALAPGAYAVVAENPTNLFAAYGVAAYGPCTGHLASDGETVRLRDSAGNTVDEVTYAVGFPWPVASAGDGASMELINPDMDNDLGGSWRASGYRDGLPSGGPLPARSPGWRYRLGNSEASSPIDAWRRADFAEDASWLDGQTPIGYGSDEVTTQLPTVPASGWMDGYTSVYLRHTFDVPDPDESPADWRLAVYVEDGCVVWLNGVEIARLHAPAGELPYNTFATAHEAAWERVTITNAQALLQAGTNVLAVHLLNQGARSTDLLFDAYLEAGAGATNPTPGRANTVWASNAPPHTRQVDHSPKQPETNEPVVVTVKVTDADGVAAVTLEYQVVRPGHYLSAWLPLSLDVLKADPYRELALNDAYTNSANWTAIAMRDDGTGGDAEAGDDIYTCTLPGQPLNRTLVRYRIAAVDALGLTVHAPLADDPRLNFAYYVYNGVPPYTVTKRTVHPDGLPHTYGTNVMRRLPVYTLITDETDYLKCMAYSDGYSSYRLPVTNDGARRKFNWVGTFVYDGVVYDHVRYRLRQRNDRYGLNGKRSLRIRFTKGCYLEARDNFGKRYPTRWRTLDCGKTVDNKDIFNFGITEYLNFHLWNMFAPPAPYAQLFHFRLVHGEDEAPAGDNMQYYGDFQGLYLAFEDYDTRFMDAHDMPEGNLYKLKDASDLINAGLPVDGNRYKRHQGRYSITSDHDYQNIRHNCRPERSESWIANHIRLDHWYRYHTVCEAVRHYDYQPADTHLKNQGWFFELFDGYANTGEVAGYTEAYGRMWSLPHDADASWGPNWGAGVDFPKYAVFGGAGKPEFKKQYRNTMREFRDLIWTPEVINTWIDRMAAIVGEFSMAERDRWIDAPHDIGYHTAALYHSMAFKTQDMKNFAFVGWTEPSPNIGPVVPAGGRAAYLDQLTTAEGEGALIPNTPTAAYTGDPAMPVNGLTFTCDPFGDPQGNTTFGALKWRVGEIADTNSPDYSLLDRPVFEYDAVWESDTLTVFTNAVRIPPDALKVDHLYRVRVRMMDDTYRWSHWSAPVAIRPGPPDTLHLLEDHLRVTELMYNPPGGNDLEFVELHNTSTNTPLPLDGVTFTDGIDFTFTNGASIPPGGYLLVIRDADAAAFRAAYGLPPDTPIAGPYEGKLDNGGETLTLRAGANGPAIVSFTYGDSRGWPTAADGGGHSLVPTEPDASERALDYGGHWRASRVIGGSPGRADPPPDDTVVINEIAAHTDYSNPAHPEYDSNDWLELYNASDAPLTLTADWYLSDDVEAPRKWRFPDTHVIPARGWLVLDELTDFHAPITTGFGLNKAGEAVCLSYLPGTGEDRIVDAVRFKGQENGPTLGRYPDGAADWFALTPTPAASNAFPAAHVLISEVMYHPAPTATHPEDNTADEFIELYNPTDETVALRNECGAWRIDGGVTYAFPTNAALPARAYALVLPFDPTNCAALAAFANTYGADVADAILFGPYAGKLSNRGERLAVERPQASDDPLLPEDVSWVIVDELIYYDAEPWPDEADGDGLSLRRWPFGSDGTRPSSWGVGGGPTPGRGPQPVMLYRPVSGRTYYTPFSETAQVKIDRQFLGNDIARIDFYDNNTMFYTALGGQDYAPLDGLAYEGTHALHAVVTDAANHAYATGTNTITVYGPPPPGPYDRMRVEFPGYMRATPLTNFPVLLRLGPAIPGFSYDRFASPNGTDLRFTDADGLQALPYDIDEWNTNGESLVWVRIPVLTAGAAIVAQWGDPRLLTTPAYVNDGSTWSQSGYEAVWHLGGTGDDRSGHGHALTDHGSADAAGTLGRARGFDGVAAYADTGLTPEWLAQHAAGLSVSFWTYPASATTGTVFGCNALNVTIQKPSRFLTAAFTLGGAQSWIQPSVALWQHVAFTLDGAHGQLYYQGTAAGTPLDYAAFAPAATPLIGYLGGATDPRYYFAGRVDELRVAGVCRSADWIWAERQTATDAAFATYAVTLGFGRDRDGDGMPDGWETLYFGGTAEPMGGPDDDHDGDGMSNAREYAAGTDPTNAASVLAILDLWKTGRVGLPTLNWGSVADRRYAVQKADAPAGPWQNVFSGLPSTPPLNVYTDNVADAAHAYFRIAVQP